MKGLLAGLCGFALSLALFLSGAAVATFILNGNPAREPRLDMNQSEIWAEQPRAVNPAAQHFERLPARAAASDVSPRAPAVTENGEEPAVSPPSERIAITKGKEALEDFPEPAVTTQGKEVAEDLPSEPEVTARDNGDEKERPSLDSMATGSVQTMLSEEQPVSATEPTAHVEWCANRYRSYRAGDNSYTSFSGGRRTCVSPYMNAAGTPSEDVSPEPTPEESVEDFPAEMDLSADATNLSFEHVDYCFSRYRSYRPEDNTYQPYDGGPRRQCR
ncbi:DNA segregation ATPase FtsK/SpoIIIE (plasmid) [Sinorhizobium americanum CCGM7]|uniref:BA14K family protein n=1 Tax=Sinorhizobium americanum TaxID=194963 RepID=UPI0004D7C183|nr:BA14K family protein [Sinorhizobium americanum]APG88782.1 DNA segregation ATPase FtsK/SpoIIIE [Sinorhizobium americanum CCGM7]